MFWSILFEDGQERRDQKRSILRDSSLNNLLEESLNFINKYQHNEKGLNVYLNLKGLSLWLKPLHVATPEAQATALRALGMIIHNLKSDVMHDFLLKSGTLADIANATLYFDHEDISPHFVTLLKIIVMRLKSSDIFLISDPGTFSFPLLTSILRYAGSRNMMLRNCSRLAAMKIFNMCDSHHSWIINYYAPAHFECLVAYIKQNIINLEDARVDNSSTQQQLFSEYCEELEYFNDILHSKSQLSQEKLRKVITLKLLAKCLLPSLAKNNVCMSATTFKNNGFPKLIISEKLTLLLLLAFFEVITDKHLLNFAAGIFESNATSMNKPESLILDENTINSGFTDHVECLLISNLIEITKNQTDPEILFYAVRLLRNIQKVYPQICIDIYFSAIFIIHQRSCDKFSEHHYYILDETVQFVKQCCAININQQNMVSLVEKIAEIYFQTWNKLQNQYAGYTNFVSDMRQAYNNYIIRPQIVISNYNYFITSGVKSTESLLLICHYECHCFNKQLQLLFRLSFFLDEILVLAIESGILPPVITENILQIGQRTNVTSPYYEVKFSEKLSETYFASIQGHQFLIFKKNEKGDVVIVYSRFVQDIKTIIEDEIEIYSVNKNKCIYDKNDHYLDCKLEHHDKQSAK